MSSSLHLLPSLLKEEDGGGGSCKLLQLQIAYLHLLGVYIAPNWRLPTAPSLYLSSLLIAAFPLHSTSVCNEHKVGMLGASILCSFPTEELWTKKAA